MYRDSYINFRSIICKAAAIVLKLYSFYISRKLFSIINHWYKSAMAPRFHTRLLNWHFESRATEFIQSGRQKGRLVLNVKQSTSFRAREITRLLSERLDWILRITVREEDGIIESRNFFSSMQVFYSDDIAR